MARQAILCACVFGVVLVGGAESRPLDNYQSIIDRNPFGLKDPPQAPVPKDSAPVAKKEEFYLTGISTIGAPNKPKKAYLISKDNSKKEYNEKYYNLTEGDRQGDLMVKEIDAKARRVKIAYNGEESWLSMKDNGVPAPAAGPAPAMAGAPGAQGARGQPGIPPPPGAMPIPLPNASGGGAPASQPAYPSANNPNRRIPRSAMTGAANNAAFANPAYTAPGVVGNARNPNPAPTPTYQGPQTDAEMIEHIINAQNPTLREGIPIPPIPTL